MANPWTARVLAFNRHRMEADEKANDMQIIAGKIAQLPPGQIKKLLDDEAIAILRKYGALDENNT